MSCSPEELAAALDALKNALVDRFGDMANANAFLAQMVADEISLLSGMDLEAMGAWKNGAPSYGDTAQEMIEEIYRDTAIEAVGHGAKDLAASVRVAGASMEGVTIAERMSSSGGLKLAELYKTTAANAERVVKGAAITGMAFVAIGAAQEIIASEEPWTEARAQAFSNAGGLLAARLAAAATPAEAVGRAAVAAVVGATAQMILEDFYEEAMDDIIYDAVNNSWTPEQLADAIRAAMEDYVNGKFSEVGSIADGLWDDIMDKLEGDVGCPLEDVPPYLGLVPVLPEPVGDALTPWRQAPNTASPLILDLDLDGVELTAFNASMTATFFDIDGDGFAEQTAWVGEDDGLLGRDLNQSGTIDSVAELFGSPGVDGFALLAELDDNGDHLIDQYDAAWSDLVIWRDENGDAITQSGELHSLTALGIVSLDLAGVTASASTIGGNPISHTSTYYLSGGGTGAIVDAWFVHDNTNAAFIGEYTLNLDTLLLPTLRGYGEIPSLHIAMSMDSTLLGLIQDFADEWEISGFEYGSLLNADVSEILWTWAGVDAANPASRGGNIDARKLMFLEGFFGNGFLQGGSNPNPYVNAARLIEESWERVFYFMKAQLVAQVGGADLFDGTLIVDGYLGSFAGTKDIDQSAIDGLVLNAPPPGASLSTYWIEVVEFIAITKGLANMSTSEETMMELAIASTDVTLSWDDIKDAVGARLDYDGGTNEDDYVNGTSSADVLYGYAGDDELDGGGGDDVLDGGTGSDILDGGADDDVLKPGSGGNTVYGRGGNDTYVYEWGDDVYSEYGAGGADTILLPSGVDAGDLYFFRAKPEEGNYWDELSIRVDGVSYITINSIFQYGRNFWSSNAIETLTFSDTTTLSISGFTSLDTFGTDAGEDIVGVKTAVEINDNIYGFGGNDELTGYGGNDLLDGGIGNDRLVGGDGNDIYIFSPGYDEISESGGADILRIPAGYDAGDVIYIRHSANPNDLVITVDGLGQVVIGGYFKYASNAVETLDFNGASAVTLAALEIESLGTSGNDTITGIITGASTNDIMDGGAGNDTLNGNAGNDTYWFSSGTDTVNDTGGTDVVKFRDGILTSEISIYRAGSSFRSLIIEDNEGNKTTINNHFYASSYAIEKLAFSDTTEWVLSSLEVETRGTSGNDVIYAYATGDASTADTVYGYAGADDVDGGYGNDVLYGGDGNDVLNGQQDDDTLYGEAGNDTLNGSAGNDWLYGGSGDDDLDGSTGNDTYFWLPDEGNDTITEGNSASNNSDTLQIGGVVTINDISVVNESSNHAKLTVSGTTGQVIIEGLRSNSNYHVETIRFSDGFLTKLPTYNSWIKGTSGNDTVAGNGSDNTLIGYAGNDTMTGGAGNDDMHGGAGNDTLDGDDGTDLLYGGDGDDILYGEGGLDTLHGGAGADTFRFFTASAFSNVDVIRDFSEADDDVLDIANILDLAFDPLSDDIADFVSFSESSGSTFVSVDRDGTGGTYSMAQIAKLENVTGLSDADTLLTNGNLVVNI